MNNYEEKFVIPGDLDVWCTLSKFCMLLETFDDLDDWVIRCNYENNKIIITVEER